MVGFLKKIGKPLVAAVANRVGPHQWVLREPRLWILMYHRILPTRDPRYALEEPGMVVQPETLRMHIQALKKQFTLTRLSTWVSAKNAGAPLPAKACVITFDDGWLDNYEYAFPILQAEQAPATVFAVAEKVGTDFQFWPNIISALLLGGASSVLENSYPFNTVFTELGHARFEVSSREFVAGFIHLLKRYSDQMIFTALDKAQWSNYVGPIKPALMNWDQLRQMQQSGLIDIGSHTCSHQRLNESLSVSELHHQVVTSRKIIESKIQAPAELFCYPNGDFSAAAVSLVEQTYLAAVTTRRGINAFKQPLHQLTRIGLHDEVSCSGSLFGARLSAWI